MPVEPPIPPSRLPRNRAERVDWLRLARSRNVGPGSFRMLMHRFVSAASALEALPRLGSAAGTRDWVPADPAAVEAEMAAGEAAGARLLCLGAPDYPPALAEIADPPAVLWAKGDAALAARPALAVVGARNASASGLRMAALLAGDLGTAGHVVVSGLARGIDTAAHRAALPTGTIAVFAGGLDRPYPEENAGLAAEIAARGLLLSETPMGLEPQARHFPRRNRIISGLSAAVILVEAAERSGSLVTARMALDQGREVMAVPGSPLDPRAAGCNLLLRQGAVLVRHAADVAEALAPPAPVPAAPARYRPAEPAPPPPADLADRIAAALGPAPLGEDALARAVGAAPADVLGALAVLDLDGRVERRPGGLVALLV